MSGISPAVLLRRGLCRAEARSPEGHPHSHSPIPFPDALMRRVLTTAHSSTDMDAEFGPVATSTLADEMAKRIAKMIQRGDYESGDRLPTINEMASRFEVGHPTLREALKKLEVLGIVKTKHGSGVYVENNEDVLLMSNPFFPGDISKDLMLNLINARIPIEIQSVVQASKNASPENIEHMEELLEKAGEHIEDGELLTETNMAFHRQIAVASGNGVIVQLLRVLSNLFEREQRTILDIYGSREKDHAEHLDILEALREGDEALAEQRMREHLEGVREMIQQWDPE